MKICEWNIENLYILLDKYNNQDLKTISNEDWQKLSIGYTTPNKHIQKIEDAAKVIQDIDADIYLLCEIGGKESLENFNKLFLKSQYNVIVYEGSSRRGLEIGFLIKKDFKFKVESKNNKKLKLSDGSYFSRNLGEIHILNKDKRLIVLLAHLKSKHSSDGDFQGMSKRELELKKINNHVDELRKKYPKSQIMVSGDFNCAKEDYELKNLQNLTDLHDFKKSSVEERCSYIYFSRQRVLHQLDYMFLSKNMINDVDLKKSYNYRFKNEYGDDLGLAESIKEKQYNCSDHYPLILELKGWNENS